jgi:hypothetical protein
MERAVKLSFVVGKGRPKGGNYFNLIKTLSLVGFAA